MMQRLLLRTTLLAAVLSCLTISARAQGCAQCLDSTRATPPAVQSAYRHAIYLLGGAGTVVFVAGVALMKRNP